MNTILTTIGIVIWILLPSFVAIRFKTKGVFIGAALMGLFGTLNVFLEDPKQKIDLLSVGNFNLTLGLIWCAIVGGCASLIRKVLGKGRDDKSISQPTQIKTQTFTIFWSAIGIIIGIAVGFTVGLFTPYLIALSASDPGGAWILIFFTVPIGVVLGGAGGFGLAYSLLLKYRKKKSKSDFGSGDVDLNPIDPDKTNLPSDIYR